ncbi:MAG: NAD-glutamate dehydrogenase domain-containing protein [Planctomycetota bacterium]
MEKTGQRTRRIVEELRADIDFELDDVISKIVGSLPEDYFTNLSRENQLTQLKALLAMGICQLDHEIMLRSEDGRHVSVIARQNYPGLLAGILRRLPRERSLIGAKIFTSTEHDFIIDVFEFETEEVVTGTETIADQELQASIEKVSQLTGAQETKIREFVSHYRTNSPILRTPKLISEHYLAFNAMRHSNDIAIRWSDLDGGRMHVTVSTGSTRPREIFERASTFFAGKSIDIDQAFLHDIPRNEYSRSAIASFIVVGEVNNQAFRPELVEELKLFLRLDEDILSKYGFADHFDSRENAELVSAVARLVGHLMKFAGSNVPFQQVNGLARKHIHAFEKCIDAIKSIGSGKSFDRTKDLVSLEYLNNPVERKVLSTLNSIIRSLTASNISVADRRTITMRFDQQLFDEFDVNEKPFAVYYCLGQGFDGFHVRFRDVARGGMRLVRTRNDEHYLVESVRVLEEAYRLAAAQQLKNKDIAEGGAKATIILKPEIDPERAGRDFVDGLMDVVLLDSIEGASEELLYLGPDENVTPRLIEWIVKRSRMRGYPYPESLISSKPKAGINHKEFGVTSEGVTVFLKRALKYAGIDPAQSPFSVKLTGLFG